MPHPAPTVSGQPRGEVVVLGAGVAGLAAADRLSRAGWSVQVIERDPAGGGSHRSHQIGPYTFDVGSMFYEPGARLFALSPELRAECPQVQRRQRRIAPGGSICHYPLDPRDLFGGSAGRLLAAAGEAAWSRLMVRRNGTLDAICRQRLGAGAYEDSGLARYIARFHHVPPTRIDESFFRDRMAFVERLTRLDRAVPLALRGLLGLRFAPRAGKPLHVRPREGFAPLFARIVAGLEARGVGFRLGEDVTAIRRGAHGFAVATSAGTVRAAAVVGTIPLDRLHRALFGAGSGLRSLDMTTLFLSAARLDPQLGNVFYNFDQPGAWKRATIYSRIYPHPATAREFLAVEVTIAPGGRHDPEAAFGDFRRHMAQRGLADDLALEGAALVRHAYPLYGLGAADMARRALDRVAAAGVVTAGRQGRFEYLPTSSRVIARVLDELDRSGLLAQAHAALA